MDALAAVFVEAGFPNVRTVIASGNVLFTSEQHDIRALGNVIENALAAALGYEVKVILRTIEQVQALVRLDPFQDIDPATAKCYVIFLDQPPVECPPLPAHFPDEHFSILGAHDADVFMIRHKLPNGPGYGGEGNYVDQTFGRVTTTRNWNTVIKIAGL